VSDATKITKTKMTAGVKAIVDQMPRPSMVGVLLRQAGWTREEVVEHQAEAIKASAKQFGDLE
jgi:hypothetical protein